MRMQTRGMFGELPYLKLSKTECDALQRAANIAAEARQRLGKIVWGFENTDIDTELAMIELHCMELAENPEIPID